jgi:hypothetical protein
MQCLVASSNLSAVAFVVIAILASLAREILGKRRGKSIREHKEN